jgi:aryl-alcohol dehydrogenase-like predicted oxidoreductase
MLRWRIDSPESEGKSMTTTIPPAAQAGSYRVGDLDLNRIGYGAMQLAGPGVFGPPRDRSAAIEVLRTAVELGVNHIDTADAYGPYITNETIREALFPYGDHVHIVTKVGVVRDERGGWLPANSPQSLREQVHDNLRRLGLDVLDVVNLRTPRRDRRPRDGSGHAHPPVRGTRRTAAAGPDPAPGPEHGQPRPAGRGAADRPGGVRTELLQHRQPGGRGGAHGNGRAAHRVRAVLPLGGFSPLQSDVLESVAKRLGATPTAVAQSWLLQHSPNIMLIPGTSSVAHLRENIAGAALTLPADAVAELDAI